MGQRYIKSRSYKNNSPTFLKIHYKTPTKRKKLHYKTPTLHYKTPTLHILKTSQTLYNKRFKAFSIFD